MVRRADPDRWLAARFVADRTARAEVVALYALNHELARVAESVSNPLIGEIRLAWWREGLEALAAGQPARAHPVLQALAPGLEQGRIPLDLLLTMVETRGQDLEPAPFADEAALVSYVEGTAGALMAAAAHVLDPATPSAVTLGAALAWGWSGLYRAGPAWAAIGRRWTPTAWTDGNDAEIALHVAHRVNAALGAAKGELKDLPVAAFPAVAYAALARPYLKHGALTDLGKQARLLAAVARGSI